MTETLILVPGLNCTDRLFGPQIEALSRSRPVTVADNGSDASIPGMAQRLLTHAPDRFVLAGLSMGGYVALEVMRQAPQRVLALALMDTTARPETKEASTSREKLIALAENGRFDEIHDLMWPRLVAERHRADHALAEEVFAMMRATGPERYVRQQRAIMARPDARPLLRRIAAPTLVLVGAEDQITPPDVAREMADAIAGASLVVVPGAGHLSTLEEPGPVSRALADWLDQRGERGAGFG
jgi:pimeloyl-ACP methyl ester carboxylesterase